MFVTTPCGRRKFLRQAGTGAMALGAAGLWRPQWASAKAEVKHPERATVGIARGSNMEEAVRRAVELSGGLDFIKPEQTVLIKPNVTGAAMSPTTTNPEVLY
ncbi:MAG: hypothetical protein AB7U73_20925, partial [Pirellulales bacterium]